MLSVFSENTVMSAALREYIERRLQPWGLTTYAYLVLSKHNLSDVLMISNYPKAWQEQYLTNNFYQRDPVILSGLKRSSPFCWDENITFRLSEIFRLSKPYNIVNGVTFVLHDHLNHVAMLSLVTDSVVSQYEQLNTHSANLQMLLIDINEQTHRLLDTPPAFTSTGLLSERDKTAFTPREHEVLYWASMGKTYDSIAIILGITERTVKFHMANLVRKMGVSNARQAIRLGVELNMITPALLQ
ncbi:LuxR family transcriptional regulator [Enterobacteriaceae bacterium 4M9]|nr:LuxR family transcriptional regulator [Enterobacteriaceae bacterium 4M9]